MNTVDLPLFSHFCQMIYAHLVKLQITDFFFIIIIIIMSCRPHGYPWPSLATFPYRSSTPTGLLDYIPYLHIAAVCMFELVVLILLGHKWGSIGVHHLCPACLVRLTWIIFVMGGRWPYSWLLCGVLAPGLV